MNKIETIEQTIRDIENFNVVYDWNNADTCNCGVIAHTLVGKRDLAYCGFEDIQSKRPFLRRLKTLKMACLFSDKTYCLDTDIPLPRVFAELRNAGFTAKDMYHLEFLNDKRIIKRVGSRLRKDKKANLLQYLRAWVTILKEEEAARIIQPVLVEDTKNITYGHIPEEIKTEARKRIAN